MIKVPKPKYDLGDKVFVCTKRWTTSCYIIQIFYSNNEFTYKLDNGATVHESNIKRVMKKANLPY